MDFEDRHFTDCVLEFSAFFVVIQGKLKDRQGVHITARLEYTEGSARASALKQGRKAGRRRNKTQHNHAPAPFWRKTIQLFSSVRA